MFKIAFASGKGGAGKTTLALSYYREIADESILIDCDVDAANCYLLLEESNVLKSEFRAGFKYSIDNDKCTNCGVCVRHCRYNAISFIDKKYRINQFLCEGCGSCTDVCRRDAIISEENYCGDIYKSLTKEKNEFYYAKLKPGEDNSGKLINELKKTAYSNSDKAKAVIDCPPGIGCPVISSLSGVDLLVVVIEATLSGFEDAKKVIELSKGKKMKRLAVINKSGVHDELEAEIEAYLLEMDIETAGKVPYRKEVFSLLKEKKYITQSADEIFCNNLKKITGVINDYSSAD